MEEQSKSGKDNYCAVRENIPSEYLRYVQNVPYYRGGKVYEVLLENILKGVFDEFKDKRITNTPAIIPVLREGKRHGGYLHPDLKLSDNVFIEVTGWADSNMIFSKIMQGYLLKKQPNYSNAKYYVVIADLGIDKGWSRGDDKNLWEQWSKIENVSAVDGWFGFKNIDILINLLKESGFK
ncbi:MAG: hypothetical protein WC568_03075 [Candidatus Methanoperedens sp.]